MAANRLRKSIMVTFLVGVLFVLTPGAAGQDVSPFATNTPAAPEPPAFVTNTPLPDLPVPLLPDAPFNRYALRLWDEPSLLTLILEQVRLLRSDDGDRMRAIQLLQTELRRRFPVPLYDPEMAPPAPVAALRQQLLEAALVAPVGMVDLRPLVRPMIERELNTRRPSFAALGEIDINGFSVGITPAVLDRTGGTGAVLTLQYPRSPVAPTGIRYTDYVLARLDERGLYRILRANPDYPAAPFDAITEVSLERVGDLTGDGLDKLAVGVTRVGGVNRELLVYGYRDGQAVSLVQPGQTILFGPDTSIEWLTGGVLGVTEFRLESPAWGCVAERPALWSFTYNFFRPPAEGAPYVTQNRLACLLYSAEPLYERPLPTAIQIIERALITISPDEDYTVGRAGMTLAMLHVLRGDIGQALEQVSQLRSNARPGSWLEEQAATFTRLAATPVTPLQLCGALQSASEYGACDVDQVLTRLFQEQPLRRDEPIEAQVARLGLSILERTTISAVGRLDRQAVRFNMGGGDWWAFAPLDEATYTAERISPPPGFVSSPMPLPSEVILPAPARQVFIDQNDPEEALNIMANALRDNPAGRPSGEIRFLQSLSYDLLSDRANARLAYFELWRSDPASVWGQLAAAHLERR